MTTRRGFLAGLAATLAATTSPIALSRATGQDFSALYQLLWEQASDSGLRWVAIVDGVAVASGISDLKITREE